MRAIDESELKTLLDAMGSACDVARAVNPSTFEARTLDGEGDFNAPYACFSALNHSRRCENCISMRAVSEGRPVSKFEVVDGEAYFISARPIVVDGKPHSLEMVQKVSDDVGIHDGVEVLLEHVQDETDREFIDGFTGAYSRSYFDAGLGSMRGRKFALLRVRNFDTINERGGYSSGDQLLKRIVHEVQAITGIEDTVIRYGGDTLAIQFEEEEGRDFPLLLQRIRVAVNTVEAESDPLLRPVVDLAAVDEEGSNVELAERAEGLLVQAAQSPERFVLRASHECHCAAPRTRRATYAESLHRASGHPVADADELTRLLSASAMRDHLQRLVEERHASHEGYRVVYLDIVNFKQFNREYGRSGGDMLLKYIAEGIRAEFPASKAARNGADMFLVVTDEPDVGERIERLRARVAGYQRKIALELKAGVYDLDEATHDAAMAIDRAKEACESIKGHYDTGIRFFDAELNQKLSITEYVVNNIDRAIEQGHIKVYFQPIIRAMTGHICDFECLCRWDDPVHGLLPPAVFIGALERLHLINKVDACVVRQACNHQAKLMAEGKPLVPVSVNLSRLDFQLDDFFSVVEQAVTEAGIPRNMLNIEVTETALDDGRGEFTAQMERFRKAGYEVWMDDFGSGYSSLNLLKSHRFDTLKMDVGFLSDFDENPKSREIVVTVVDMAKKLGLRTLAEGVETRQQYRFLQRIGCEMLQGYYFSHPLPYGPDAFAGFAVEDAGERAYFDELGSVNLLGIPASGEWDEALADGFVTESESRSVPMALLERRDGRYGYLSANEAYLKLLEDVDIHTLDELQEAMSGGAYRISDYLVRKLDAMRASREDVVDVRSARGVKYRLHVRHAATGPGADAYIVIPSPLS